MLIAGMGEVVIENECVHDHVAGVVRAADDGGDVHVHVSALPPSPSNYPHIPPNTLYNQSPHSTHPAYASRAPLSCPPAASRRRQCWHCCGTRGSFPAGSRRRCSSWSGGGVRLASGRFCGWFFCWVWRLRLWCCCLGLRIERCCLWWRRFCGVWLVGPWIGRGVAEGSFG